jgi:hypothetical protein
MVSAPVLAILAGRSAPMLADSMERETSMEQSVVEGEACDLEMKEPREDRRTESAGAHTHT